MSPDCRVAKHRVCDGGSWDYELDQPTECTCPCHGAGVLAA